MRPRTTTLSEPTLAIPAEQVAADLRGAAALIRGYGLSKGRYHDPRTGAFDQSGAIMETICPGFWTRKLDPAATYMDDERRARYVAAERAMRSFLGSVALVIPGLGSAATRWNDAPERTAGQVAAALETAADSLERAA